MSPHDTPSTISFTRRNLPHWLVAERTYFITIRLAGTIPRDVVAALLAERNEQTAASGSDEAELDLQRRQFSQIEAILDAHQPERDWLTRPPVAKAFFNALPWLETPDRGWDIYAATLMATHAHMVMRNTAGRSGELLADLGQFKRHTGRVCNQLLERTGSFWAREPFDHWCRTEEKVIGAIRYTVKNPVKARLCLNWQDWRWTRIQEDWRARAQL